MNESVQVVYLEPPESARYVVPTPNSAQYVVYGSSSSLLPSSFDQVLKNHVLVVGGHIEDLQPFSGAPAADFGAAPTYG